MLTVGSSCECKECYAEYDNDYMKGELTDLLVALAELVALMTEQDVHFVQKEQIQDIVDGARNFSSC